MKPFRFSLGVLLAACLGTALAAKAPSKPSAGKPVSASAQDPSLKPLDIAAVKSYYNDGDFPQAIDMLEDFQKTHATFTREESLTVYKYLGVMYCADQATREKGKSYFYKLLKIDPEAKILDMYVSIVVQDIFRQTLDELMNTTGTGRSDRTVIQDSPPTRGTFPAPKPTAARQEKPVIAEKKDHTALWWIGGAALAAGVAGSVYYLTSSSGGSSGETDIPVGF